MLLNCDVGEDSWESLGLKVYHRGNQPWISWAVHLHLLTSTSSRAQLISTKVLPPPSSLLWGSYWRDACNLEVPPELDEIWPDSSIWLVTDIHSDSPSLLAPQSPPEEPGPEPNLLTSLNPQKGWGVRGNPHWCQEPPVQTSLRCEVGNVILRSLSASSSSAVHLASLRVAHSIAEFLGAWALGSNPDFSTFPAMWSQASYLTSLCQFPPL